MAKEEVEEHLCVHQKYLVLLSYYSMSTLHYILIPDNKLKRPTVVYSVYLYQKYTSS